MVLRLPQVHAPQHAVELWVEEVSIHLQPFYEAHASERPRMAIEAPRSTRVFYGRDFIAGGGHNPA
jgi:hypothetical protein